MRNSGATGRALRAVGSAAALTIVLGACAAQADSPPRSAGTPAPTPSAGTPASALHLPIEAYLLPPRLSVTYDRIRGTLIHDCMRDHGHPYPAPPRSGSDQRAVDAYTVMYRRYGVTDPAAVRTWGYRRPRPAAGAPPAAATGVRLSDFTPAAQRVLLGRDPETGKPVRSQDGRTVPAGGCVGAANHELGDEATSPQGPQTGPGELVAAIKHDSFEASRTDPRVSAVFAAWSACMKSQGYRLSDPMHASDRLPKPADGRPGRTEIAQATADVTCKARTNLVGVWFAVESGYQNAAIREHGAALARVRTQLDDEAGRLRRLAAAGHAG